MPNVPVVKRAIEPEQAKRLLEHFRENRPSNRYASEMRCGDCNAIERLLEKLAEPD